MNPADLARLRRSHQQAAGESSRTAALREAERLQAKHGPGLSLAGPPSLQIGDRVAYAAHWLRAVQAHHLGDARGTVIEAGGCLVRVEWDGGPACGAPVLARNVVLVSRMHLEAP